MSNKSQLRLMLPNFTALDFDTFKSDLIEQLDKIYHFLESIKLQPLEWDSIMQPMLDLLTELNNLYSPLTHLYGVQNTDTLRNLKNECDLILSDFYTHLYQHTDLFDKLTELKKSKYFASMDLAQKKAIDSRLRDFKLSGVSLDSISKKTYQKISNRLTQLSNEFSNNVLDSTSVWYFDTDQKSDLLGLSENLVEIAADNAKEANVSGYRLKLDYPTYYEVIHNSENRNLRKLITKAWMTRASDIGPGSSAFDNTTIIEEILTLRFEIAKLLGFDNYAEYSLANKMADSTSKVTHFLNELAQECKIKAQEELADLQAFSKHMGFDSSLEIWDIPYYSQKLKKSLYDFNDEDIRPYFPVTTVIPGFFKTMSKIFDIDFNYVDEFDHYHDDLQFLSLKKNNEIIAYCYLDLYARDAKRSGAWMDVARSRVRFLDGQLQKPVAYLVCNFPKNTSNQPSLLTHNEVITLFHEFGHGLHHMLSTQECLDVSGINGVPWDAVELPSQLLENWCWDKNVLKWMSSHYQTGESLPEDLLDRMLDAKHFHTGLAYLRQLVFAIFDFKLHCEYQPDSPIDSVSFFDSIVSAIDVRKNPEFNRMPQNFSHIFSGGYSAGYYSYLWAEVLSADAFSLFEEKGLFDQATAQSFIKNILSTGSSLEITECFKCFRGRDPKIDALLKQAGIY